jgi:hypothetical protein
MSDLTKKSALVFYMIFPDLTTVYPTPLGTLFALVHTKTAWKKQTTRKDGTQSH